MLCALCLFCLFSCTKTASLFDLVTAVTAADTSLPAGTVLCYGKPYENSISEDTLSDYLGLSGYPAFKDKIEDLAFFSTLQGNYAELAVMRLYRVSDAADGVLFFERRIKDTARTLRFSGKTGYADKAYVRTYGNVVVLYMLPDNASAEKAVRGMI